MKTSYFSSIRAWCTVVLATVCLFAFTAESYADRSRIARHNHHKHNHGRVYRGHHHNYHHHHHRHHDRYQRNRYFAYPRSNFGITFGNGYAGRGYYYGPPSMPYYYRGPGVIYYNRRAMVPSRYW